jgi:hypothetical protein
MTTPRTVGCGLLISSLLLGCSPSAPPPTDFVSARAVVEEALAAWKEAATVQGLRDRSDSIFVAEPRWEAGWRLDGYEVVDQVVDGFQTRCKVNLSMIDPQGKPSRETAEYLATTAPKRTVTRVSAGW